MDPLPRKLLHHAIQADTVASVCRQLAQGQNPRGRYSDKSAGAALLSGTLSAQNFFAPEREKLIVKPCGGGWVSDPA